MADARSRSVRNRLARVLMEGYDETWGRYRFMLMTADMVLSALKDLPSPLVGTQDYITDGGLTNIEALASKLPQEFTINQQVWPKRCVVTFKFDGAKDVFERAEDVPRLLEAAMCIDTLCKNLRAERERLVAR